MIRSRVQERVPYELYPPLGPEIVSTLHSPWMNWQVLLPKAKNSGHTQDAYTLIRACLLYFDPKITPLACRITFPSPSLNNHSHQHLSILLLLYYKRSSLTPHHPLLVCLLLPSSSAALAVHPLPSLPLFPFSLELISSSFPHVLSRSVVILIIYWQLLTQLTTFSVLENILHLASRI